MLFPRFKKKIVADGLLHDGEGVVIGVSGGIDSMVLMHLLKRLAPVLHLRLMAAHVNYRLRGKASDGDAVLVKGTAEAWHVAYSSIAVTKKFRGNFQDEARNFRRSFFQDVAGKATAQVIALGHHQQDQAETILAHLVRGSGLTGLCGMAAVDALGPCRLIRPLLEFDRSAIEKYAARHHIPYRHDASNDRLRYQRNAIRHRLLPLFEEFNPKAVKAIASLGKRLAEDRDLLSAVAEEAFRQTCLVQQRECCVLNQAIFASFPPGVRTRILQYAFAALDVRGRRLNADQVARLDRLSQARSPQRKLYQLPAPWVFTTLRQLLIFAPKALLQRRREGGLPDFALLSG